MFVCVLTDSLSEALKAISVSTELIEEELKPHLDTVLAALLEKSKSYNAPAHTHTHTHTHTTDLSSTYPSIYFGYQTVNHLTQLSSNM